MIKWSLDYYYSLIWSEYQSLSLYLISLPLGVYTRNRIFRLYKSSKLGKDVSLTVHPHNQFQYESEYDLFLKSLVCNIDTNDDTNDNNHKNRILTVLICDPSNDTCSKRALPTTTTSSATYLPSQSNSDLIPSPPSIQYGSSDRSPYPDIDQFIAKTEYIHRNSIDGYIRSWLYFPDSQVIVYNIGNNRYCGRIERQHKSNHIFMVADLLEGVYYQKCYDPGMNIIRTAEEYYIYILLSSLSL